MISRIWSRVYLLLLSVNVALASTDTLTAWLKHAQEQQQAQSGVPTVRRPPVGSPLYGFPSNNTLSIPKLEDGACTGYICGNKQFITEPNNGSVAKVPAAEKVKIIVFSVWVGDKPLEVNKLNHKQYCDANGYEYKHFYLNNTEFAQRYTTQPSAWLSVFAAKELLATSDAQYFFKMDIDCLFVRNDVRLETLIDPLQRYSFYTTNIESQSRFMQSQSWILKNSEFGKAFIEEWLEYVHWGRCGNLAMEQGAMHLAIGMAYKWSTGDSSTAYICPHWCISLRSVYLHHHCVLDWLEDNGFGVSNNGSMNTHPNIYVYSFPKEGNSVFVSPDDGFILEFGQFLNRTRTDVSFKPLTVHPLKKHIYDAPTDVMQMLINAKRNIQN